MVRKPFNLSRWFAIVGLVSIASISVVSGVLLSRFLTGRMLQQEARLTREFVDSIVRVEKASGYFDENHRAPARELRDSFEHVWQLPDVMRANLYSRRGTVLWSSDPALVGREFRDNPELDEALRGNLVVHGGERAKTEHAELDERYRYFVEIYSPVLDDAGREVIGVVELYKTPQALFEALAMGRRAIWAGAAVAGLFLYAALFWMVRRADALIRLQRERLVQSETLAVVGEMSSAVAHGIRNPLASIRSSAELSLGCGLPEWRGAASEIVEQVDRLESWVRQLLSYAQPLGGKPEPVEIGAVLQASLGLFDAEARRRGIRLSAHFADALPPVTADPLMLEQAFNSLISNAVEAIDSGGAVTIAVERETERRLRVRIRDSGRGMSREELEGAFKPFHTTKRKGLGVGLPLARRIVQRFGGSIAIATEPGRGTTVDVLLPAA